MDTPRDKSENIVCANSPERENHREFGTTQSQVHVLLQLLYFVVNERFDRCSSKRDTDVEGSLSPDVSVHYQHDSESDTDTIKDFKPTKISSAPEKQTFKLKKQIFLQKISVIDTAQRENRTQKDFGERFIPSQTKSDKEKISSNKNNENNIYKYTISQESKKVLLANETKQTNTKKAKTGKSEAKVLKTNKRRRKRTLQKMETSDLDKCETKCLPSDTSDEIVIIKPLQKSNCDCWGCKYEGSCEIDGPNPTE
ncbi:hypothetical protein RFI_00407 [Reticulomyxa filosa]|uniref:Uncharacterized protein n=1 Tax=Reticulomyxa filosa TaxID=46433 RepID=X6PG29_RETFI|nr:hypothetical protein RFI_00407 [Reticulomyxa filosa]|eukprot:ETO36652.1 hypothetical protein RFI_00407 [Reticulomyxa filosa]